MSSTIYDTYADLQRTSTARSTNNRFTQQYDTAKEILKEYKIICFDYIFFHRQNKLENVFPYEFHYTNSNKSRNFSIPNNQYDLYLIGLQQLYGLSSGIYKYKEEQPSNQFIEMKNNKHIDKLESLFISKPKLFCINNIESDTFPFLDKYFN